MKTKHITNLALLLSLAASCPLATAEEAAAEAKTEAKLEGTAAPAIMPGSLAAVIHDSVTFSILDKALKASGLDVTLGGSDNFTVFAPTDEAFAKLPEGTLDKLMLPQNKEKLRSLLLFHVVAGKVNKADLKDMDMMTMNGEKFKIDADGDGDVEINGAKLSSPDVAATNGVMHSVDEVLVPKSLDEFADLED